MPDNVQYNLNNNMLTILNESVKKYGADNINLTELKLEVDQFGIVFSFSNN